MLSTGWISPGQALAGPQNLSNNEWTDPDNVKADDFHYASHSGIKFDKNSPAEAANDPGDGPELITFNYGFSIPSAAVIAGIEVKVQAYNVKCIHSIKSEGSNMWKHEQTFSWIYSCDA